MNDREKGASKGVPVDLDFAHAITDQFIAQCPVLGKLPRLVQAMATRGADGWRIEVRLARDVLEANVIQFDLPEHVALRDPTGALISIPVVVTPTATAHTRPPELSRRDAPTPVLAAQP